MDQLITSMLKKRKNRVFGLRLLICYLRKTCIKLDENVHIWLSILLKSCSISDFHIYGDLIFSSIALLIDKIQNDSNLSKAFGSTHLFKTLECLSQSEIYENERLTLSALQIMKRCLKYYPKGIASRKTYFEKILLLLIDNHNVDIVYQTGECWFLFQNILGNFNNEKIWKDFQLTLVSDILYIIKKSFGFSEETRYNSNAKIFGFHSFEYVKDPLERATHGFRRILNLTEYLKISLRKQYPIKKYICTARILGLIDNGLEMLSNQRNNIRINDVCFESYIPKIQIKLLELLEILIDICHTNLRMEFRLVLNIVIGALERTKLLITVANRNQVMRVRIVVYKVISSWCSTLQEGSHCEIISDTLIKEILDDLIPYQQTTLINRAESRLKRKRSTENGFSMFEQPIGNEESGLLCQHAMFCLQNFLLSSGHLLKPQLLKDVHNTLLESCILMHTEPTKNQNLNSTWNYRLKIYNSFEFLLKSQNYRCPAPTEIILGLLNESNLFVNSTALRKTYNIKDLELMLRPQKAGTRLEQGTDNFTLLHLETSNISDLKNSKCLSCTPFGQCDINDKDQNLVPSNADNSLYNEVNCTNLSMENISTQNVKKLCTGSLGSSHTRGSDFYTGPSSCRDVRQYKPTLPKDFETLDDAKMITDLEEIFVEELK